MVETVSSDKDWNTSSMRIVEFPKLIGQSTTAVLLVGFVGEGTAAFTDGKNMTALLLSYLSPFNSKYTPNDK